MVDSNMQTLMNYAIYNRKIHCHIKLPMDFVKCFRGLCLSLCLKNRNGGNKPGFAYIAVGAVDMSPYHHGHIFRTISPHKLYTCAYSSLQYCTIHKLPYFLKLFIIVYTTTSEQLI